jgi:hypothetical protein
MSGAQPGTVSSVQPPLPAGRAAAIAALALTVVACVLAAVVLALQTVQYARAVPATGPTGFTGSTVVIYPQVLVGPTQTGEYGDGRDGDVTFSNGVFALTGDAFYSTLTLNNATLMSSGWRIFASVALVASGASSIVCRGGVGGDNANLVIAVGTGGAGAPAGSLGGGGRGGDGFKQFFGESSNGGAVGCVPWVLDTSACAGAPGTTSTGTAPWRSGLGGVIRSFASKAGYELAQALNPTFVPVRPLLGGGSGGGGGQGSANFSGSGGGGGGGVVVVAARSLVVPSNALVVDVSGGDGGTLENEGPAIATSGGGGGGGVFVLNTQSNVASYASIVVARAGGAYVDSAGAEKHAADGLFIDYNTPEFALQSFNPQQQLFCSSTTTQPAFNNNNTVVRFPNVLVSQGIQYFFDNTVRVSQAGVYLVQYNAPTNNPTNAPAFLTWLSVNGSQPPYTGLCGPQAFLSLSATITLQPNDILAVLAWQNSGSDYVITGANLGQLCFLRVLLLKPA